MRKYRPLPMTGRTDIIRTENWHLWKAPGLRFGLGVIPQFKSTVDRRTEVLVWFGPWILSRRVGVNR